MDMTGKALPVYRHTTLPLPSDQLIAHGDVNKLPCTITVSRHDGDAFLVATIGGKSVAVSVHELAGVAAAEAV